MAMLRSLLLLFVIFSMGNAAHISGCRHGWTNFGQRCYKYFSLSVHWVKAERNCQSLGANLASVHDQPENDFLLSLLPSSTRAWVGGHDGEQDGEWLWSDGSVYDYDHWCSGEPNNFDVPENCLEINWNSNRCWNDSPCSTSMKYICVSDIERTTPPFFPENKPISE
ncbi:ladderlectin-like [Rhinichthys klamathensis goyatoka]|uniref:ladderlectin-like n=1 Tax=Rhinichthys klamathensis goyatoka TaxID=3034132 RepID=UPI0024B53AE7|nr:ladderlectin-like [Rhinichthys klamathensis goyatoka]